MYNLEDYYLKMGGLSDVFYKKNFAYLMVHKNKIIKSQEIEGLSINCKSTPEGVNLEFCLSEGYKIKNPVIICFGILPEKGIQKINRCGKLEKESSMDLRVYCAFPNEKRIRHYMEGDVEVGKKAFFKYAEFHYPGKRGE